MTQPAIARVTALLPLKHFEKRFLEDCLRSLFQQSCAQWRCVVIVEPEDESRFRDLLATELEDSRFELCANQGRKLAGALNTGIRRAQTEFVAILLGDDLWDTEAVGVLNREIAADPDVDFFSSARRFIDDHGVSISDIVPSRAGSFVLADFEHACPIKHLLCFRRSMALEVGGLDESLNNVGPDDYDFPWTMAENGARFKAIGECLYIYRDHRQSYRLTTHLPMSQHMREIYRIQRKHGVPRHRAIRRVLQSRQGFLRQCLFGSPVHRWLRERMGYSAADGWRETYR